MIASHDQITTMASHLGLGVIISKRGDGRGSKYEFLGPDNQGKIGLAMSPKEARAWLQGYQAHRRHEFG